MRLSPPLDLGLTNVNPKPAQPSRRPVVLVNASEDDVQIAFIDYCRRQRDERRLTLHIPNEAKRSEFGHARMVRKGLIPGAADNFIPAARGGWNGLWLELKAKGKKPTRAQIAFGVDMNAAGYAWAWADSIDLAMSITERYMAGRLLRPNWVHYEAPAQV